MTIPFEIGPFQDRLLQLGQFQRGKPGRPTRRLTVVKPGDPLGVIANHRVAQSLTVHTNKAGGLSSPNTVKSMGKRKHPQRSSPVLLVTRQRAQIASTHVSPDR